QDEVGGYPDYAATSRSLTVPDGAEARQEWLDSLEDEIAVDTLIDLSRLYSLVGSEASDKFRSHSGFTSSTPHGDYSSGVSITDIVTYPNPVTAKLKVALGNDFAEGAFIQLFDYTGRMVLSLESTGIENSINVENLPPGLYIIRVSWGAKCIIQHIMKK
ncbi:MAG: T9SS type A sorting domain-containing protein, partial [Bacteroidales bacterium]|nr:T9SS type A sorting domain-containing protein [Bacteroidales bacterium]